MYLSIVVVVVIVGTIVAVSRLPRRSLDFGSNIRGTGGVREYLRNAYTRQECEGARLARAHHDGPVSEEEVTISLRSLLVGGCRSTRFRSLLSRCAVCNVNTGGGKTVCIIRDIVTPVANGGRVLLSGLSRSFLFIPLSRVYRVSAHGRFRAGSCYFSQSSFDRAIFKEVLRARS